MIRRFLDRLLKRPQIMVTPADPPNPRLPIRVQLADAIERRAIRRSIRSMRAFLQRKPIHSLLHKTIDTTYQRIANWVRGRKP